MKKLSRRLLVFAICTLSVASVTAGPTKVSAFWRDGQTFLTWQEDKTVEGEWYNIYASDRPITAASLAKADCIAKIPDDSNHFQFLRNIDTTRGGFFAKLVKEKWYRAIQIQDDPKGAKQLSDDTGLFVRTIKKPSKTFYAVVPEVEGTERRNLFVALTEPVDEQPGQPGAVLLQELGDRHYIYAFFCDYELWNPDGVEDNWEGYVHVFQIRAPSINEKRSQEPYPVGFRPHAYQAYKDWNIGYCWPGWFVTVTQLDYHLTWWYGYSDALPKLEGKPPAPPPAPVVNFTERRVMQVARWLQSNPHNFPFKVDPGRFYMYGGSMGGTGTHVMGTRNGDVFAAVLADEGISDWSRPASENSWVRDVRAKYGPQERNDITNEGVPVYELLNLPKQVAAHPERELPFMDIGQGIVDTIIPFNNVIEYWKALEKGKHAYAATWEVQGHSPWVGPASAMDYRTLRRDEVVPAFANASCNDELRSGFRLTGDQAGLTSTTLTIAKGTFPPNLVGKSLLLAATPETQTAFTIKSNTDTELTIEEGGMVAYLPKMRDYDRGVLKRIIKRDEDVVREPTETDISAHLEKRKKRFLICDGVWRGTWNGHFRWSTRDRNFDPKRTEDDTVDEANMLAICLRVDKHRRSKWDGESATADVTPRRARKFMPDPGEVVHWENWDFTDPSAPRKTEQGEVKADAHGLVTVPGFVIRRAGWGSRLVLKRM